MSETIKLDTAVNVPEYQMDEHGNLHGRDGSAIINTVGTQTANPTRLQVPIFIGPYEGSKVGEQTGSLEMPQPASNSEQPQVTGETPQPPVAKQ